MTTSEIEQATPPIHRRAKRRHQTHVHMMRRLKEDRNQHYNDLDCPCWTDPKAIARFKESPARCSCLACGNPRRHQLPLKERLTRQELRALLPE
jgi:hypothetical protein